MSSALAQPNACFPDLETTIQSLPEVALDAERKTVLRDLADWIRDHKRSGLNQPAEVVFICTHNSRRSQMAQAWFAALAHRQGLDIITTFSGGTEVTAFNPRAVACLQRAGFQIESSGEETTNPHYAVRFSPETDPLDMFSKRYDHPVNPARQFAAVMVCSEADAACPIVFGAGIRIPLPFTDPKAADGTEEEQSTYDLRSRQIASEMKYVIDQILNHE